MSYVVAIGGATGNVGRTMREILEQRHFPVSRLYLLASERSSHEKRSFRFRGKDIVVSNLANHNFADTDFLFLSTGGENSRHISPHAASQKCFVIDNSSAFRMEEACPLIVPEINGDLVSDSLARGQYIFPVANCSTIQLTMILKPLNDFVPIRRVVVSTYQSCSGGGKALLNRLMNETLSANGSSKSLAQASREAEIHGAPKPLAHNVIPHIDTFLSNGSTKEEWKMEVETRKILATPTLQLSATCVRVPTFTGHAEAVNIEFENTILEEDLRRLLSTFPGIKIKDLRENCVYSTPLDAQGCDEVFVSRIRPDRSAKNTYNLWIVSDNVRKGAALNAVQIAEQLVACGVKAKSTCK